MGFCGSDIWGGASWLVLSSFGFEVLDFEGLEMNGEEAVDWVIVGLPSQHPQLLIINNCSVSAKGLRDFLGLKFYTSPCWLFCTQV